MDRDAIPLCKVSSIIVASAQPSIVKHASWPVKVGWALEGSVIGEPEISSEAGARALQSCALPRTTDRSVKPRGTFGSRVILQTRKARPAQSAS